jgi:deoxycytidylate deaminase
MELFSITNEEQITDMLRTAYTIARDSQHPTTQVGAMLLDPMGFPIGSSANRVPPGLKRPAAVKNMVGDSAIEHAERAAIFASARAGKQTAGSTLVAPWFSCVECARAIVAAGVSRVIGHAAARDRTYGKWLESIEKGDHLLLEAGIEIIIYHGTVGRCLSTINGETWLP